MMGDNAELTLMLLRNGAWFGKTVLFNRLAGDLEGQPIKILSLNDANQVEVELKDGRRLLVPPAWVWLTIRDEYNPVLQNLREIDDSRENS